MKKHIVLFVVTLFLVNNLSLAVDLTVSSAVDWNEAIARMSSENVNITLINDITVNGSFNITNNWNGRSLTINGNGKKLTISGSSTFEGNFSVTYSNLDLTLNTMTITQNTKVTLTNTSVNVSNLVLNGGAGVTLNVNSGSSFDVAEKTDMGTQSTINVSGTFESSSFTSHDGSSTLKVLDNGCARVKGDGIVTSGANFSVSQNGQLRFDGDFTLTNGSNMTLNGDMEVYGNMDVYYGNSTIDGTLRVAGNLSIYYDNDGGNENITGSGTIAANEFYCKDNNATSGESCVSQLSNHFNVNNIQRGNVVMPIVLSSFTASAQTNIVNVYWTTESEQNNDYFTIYRSADGENFEQIGTEAGAGNSTMTLNYSFVDYYPLDGVSYYLIQQTDYDGTSKYSKKVVVKRSLSVEPCMVKVFPNPYKNGDGLTIDLGASNNANVQVQIVDAMGKVVSNVSCKTIGSAMRINPKLNAGVYMVKVSVDGQTSTQKLVVE